MNRILDRMLALSGGAFAAVTLMAIALPSHAGDVLFVSDSLTDANNIPSVLSGGSVEVPHATIPGASFRPAVTASDHNVTIIRNDYTVTGGAVFAAEGTNPALAGVQPGVALADYCSVFWSASGPHEPDVFNGGFGADGGLHTDSAVFSNLGTYVAGGGYVFVTGHDAATHPIDPLVEGFVGGTGAIAVQQLRVTPNSAPFGTVSAANNALGSGVVNLGGSTPGAVAPGGVNTLDGVQDLDYIAGTNGAEVTSVVTEAAVAGGIMWTERVPLANGGSAAGSDFSQGRVAYVANGIFLFEDLPFNPNVFLSDGEDASWLNDTAYNGALRNFAFNGCVENTPPVAADDDYTGMENVTLNVAAPGVLVNDNDDDNDTLTAVVGTAAANGSLTLNGNGSFSYVPDANSCGDDSFTYFANDGSDNGNEATVSLDIMCDAPEPPPRCDIDADSDVDRNDIMAIVANRNQPSAHPDDPMDYDGNGWIDVLDARGCMSICTLPRCAVIP
jgi:VCBS repeat-containing protein